jgi:hypothetical protein
MPHKNRKKEINFMFCAGCSSLTAERFSCSLDILYRGLGMSKFQFTAVNFFKFWSSNPGSRIGIQPKMLDPDPDSVNPDRKH